MTRLRVGGEGMTLASHTPMTAPAQDRPLTILGTHVLANPQACTELGNLRARAMLILTFSTLPPGSSNRPRSSCG